MAPILRSVLFVPGTRADRFGKALAAGADAVVFDLEDGVEAARKDGARRIVAEWLGANPPAGPTARFVRVNGVRSAWIDADLAWLPRIADVADAVVLPKTESARDVERVAAAWPSRRVIPLLETSRGILAAAAIAGAHAEVPALLFGAEDLTAELGIPRTLAGEEILLARSQVVLAAATIGADAVDAVFVDLKAADRLRADAARARALGFRGKMAIHPDQVAVINEVFTPSAEEVAAARRIVDADASARARGDGAFRLDDRMVDAPIVARARRVLEGTGLFSTDSAKRGRR
ncbi:MAG TPA: CoA ester lyase, partial [Vicinamibacterales bacterium]|nr:CoA ester lyase [Vicinamibacterales bacterium]